MTTITDCFRRRLSSNGSEILTPNYTSVKIWNVSTGNAERTFNSTMAAHAVFSPSGKELVVGSYKQDVTVLNTTTGKIRLTLRGHTNSVKALAYSANGEWIATGSEDGTVRIWDATTGNLARFAANTDALSVKHVELSNDGSDYFSVTVTWTVALSAGP